MSLQDTWYRTEKSVAYVGCAPKNGGIKNNQRHGNSPEILMVSQSKDPKGMLHQLEELLDRTVDRMFLGYAVLNPTSGPTRETYSLIRRKLREGGQVQISERAGLIEGVVNCLRDSSFWVMEERDMEFGDMGIEREMYLHAHAETYIKNPGLLLPRTVIAQPLR